MKIATGLILAAGLDTVNLPVETARLPTLELYREGRVSLRRAAEFCQISVGQFSASPSSQH